MKCGACPLAGRPEVCRGESVKRFCELVAGGRCDYASWLYSDATGTPAQFSCPDDEPVVPPVSMPPQVPHTVDGGVPVAVSVAVIRCEHRTKLPNCGCVGKWRCERDQRDVTWAECVVCKTAEADSTS